MQPHRLLPTPNLLIIFANCYKYFYPHTKYFYLHTQAAPPPSSQSVDNFRQLPPPISPEVLSPTSPPPPPQWPAATKKETLQLKRRVKSPEVHETTFTMSTIEEEIESVHHGGYPT